MKHQTGKRRLSLSHDNVLFVLLCAASLFLVACGDDDSGRSVCTDECGAGSAECSENGVRSCGDFNGDGCTEWSAVTECSAGQSCESGVCGGGACTDACTLNTTECSGDGVRTCGDSDSDGCTEWSAVTSCTDTQTCTQGACIEGCIDECIDGSSTCRDNGFVTCGNTDADACLEWSEVTPCDMGLLCSFGECTDTCANECGTNGQRQCSGNGVQTCGDFDTDDCLEWGDVTACETDETCSQGTCRTGCFNECSENTAQCAAGGGVQTCGNFDTDDCFEWSTEVACADTETCSQGACSDTCTNECSTIGQSQCTSGGT